MPSWNRRFSCKQNVAIRSRKPCIATCACALSDYTVVDQKLLMGFHTGCCSTECGHILTLLICLISCQYIYNPLSINTQWHNSNGNKSTSVVSFFHERIHTEQRNLMIQTLFTLEEEYLMNTFRGKPKFSGFLTKIPQRTYQATLSCPQKHGTT